MIDGDNERARNFGIAASMQIDEGLKAWITFDEGLIDPIPYVYVPILSLAPEETMCVGLSYQVKWEMAIEGTPSFSATRGAIALMSNTTRQFLLLAAASTLARNSSANVSTCRRMPSIVIVDQEIPLCGGVHLLLHAVPELFESPERHLVVDLDARLLVHAHVHLSAPESSFC